MGTQLTGNNEKLEEKYYTIKDFFVQGMGRLIATSCPVNHREINTLSVEHLHSISHLHISVKIVVPELSSNALVCFSLCVLLHAEAGAQQVLQGLAIECTCWQGSAQLSYIAHLKRQWLCKVGLGWPAAALMPTLLPASFVDKPSPSADES